MVRGWEEKKEGENDWREGEGREEGRKRRRVDEVGLDLWQRYTSVLLSAVHIFHLIRRLKLFSQAPASLRVCVLYLTLQCVTHVYYPQIASGGRAPIDPHVKCDFF